MDEWVSELLVASVSFPGLTNATYIYVSIAMEDEEVIKCRLKLFKTQKLFLFQVLQHDAQLACCLVTSHQLAICLVSRTIHCKTIVTVSDRQATVKEADHVTMMLNWIVSILVWLLTDV